MTRTRPIIAVVVLALFLSAASVIPTSGEAQAETDRDAAIAAITRLEGRITFDERKNVTHLDLDNAKITDTEMKQLKGLTDLESLSLNRTPITDAGLEHLKGLSKLASLELYETVVSDAGLEHLKGLTKLKFLLLKRTNVTEAGAGRLQQTLPDCLISHSPRDLRIAEIVLLSGRWSVEFANGVKQVCEIREDGTASAVEPRRTSGGKAGVQNRTIVFAYDDDRVERWTVVGKQYVVEHWAPVPGSQRWEGHAALRPLPTSIPVLGIAERVQ